jgi:hypothetical protein
MVQEDEISGLLVNRPLAGVEVEVSASNLGIYNSWGTVRTNSDGYFTLREEKDGSKRKIKVKVRFADSELEVNAGALANPGDFISPAMVVFEHSREVEGPSINIGTRTFKPGASGELGETDHIRRAIAWYACKKIINTLQAKDSYFDFNGKVKIIYPAKVVSGIPYANGVTRCAYIQSGWWDIQTVIHEMMHLWNYDHNHGTANWFGAVFCPPDLNTHGQAERRPIAFHEGFAEYASQELLYELWGPHVEPGSNRKKEMPYSRHALLNDLHLDTSDEVEMSDKGVRRALALMTSRNLYTLKFGTKNNRTNSDPYPDTVDTSGHVCPAAPSLDIWDVLKVFQANSSKGYATEWQVGNNDYGVRRFFERAADVLSGLDDATKDLMLSLIDPTSTVQPQSRCTSNKPPAGSGGRAAAAQTGAKPVAQPAKVAV